MKRIILISLSILFTCSFVFAQQTQKVSLSTFYPSPYGNYKYLRLVPQALPASCADGTIIVDENDDLNVCKDGAWSFSVSGSKWTKSVDFLYPNDWENDNLRIGIGTDLPEKRLHILNTSGQGFMDGILLQNEGAFGTFDGANIEWRMKKPYVAGNRHWNIDMYSPVASARHLRFFTEDDTNDLSPRWEILFRGDGNGIHTHETDNRAIISKGLDRFTGGAYGNDGGIGRWGLFKEFEDSTIDVGKLILGIPNPADATTIINESAVVVRKYELNSTGTDVFRVESDGKVGILNNSPVAQLNIGGEGSIFSQTNHVAGAVVPAAFSTAPKETFLWYPPKGVFRVGKILATELNDTNLGEYSSVTGGKENYAVGVSTVISGGETNKVYQDYSSIGGGQRNTIGPPGTLFKWSVITGGVENEVTNHVATICGGTNNNISGHNGSILGGIGNTVSGGGSGVIIGGGANVASGNAAVIIGGNNNTASGFLDSVVLGGEHNTAGGDYTMVGGRYMQLDEDADRTFVWGYADSAITISQPDSFIIYPDTLHPGKMGINTATPKTALEVNGLIKTTPRTAATAGGCGVDQKGSIYFDSTTNEFKGCDGSGTWKTLTLTP